MKCAICKQTIKGSGNSALPLSEERCCNTCYFEHVVPAKACRYGVLIPAKGRAKPYEIKGISTYMELTNLQEAVGGYIQPVKVDSVRNETILVDEDGKCKNKPLNKAATYIAHNYLLEGDCIVGDALLVIEDDKNFRYMTYKTAKVRAELINGMTECF